MRALRFSRHGEPGAVLELAELPVPRPGPGEVLIRVHAAGINPTDVGMLEHPQPFIEGFRLPATPGWDVAGTVAGLGAGVDTFGEGDEVFGLAGFPRLGSGTFAECTTVAAAQLAARPARLSWVEAGAMPLVALTVLQAFDAVGGIRPGTRVLVERAAGGVGHVATQYARAAGATVIGTASRARHDFLRAHGVAEPVDYTTAGNVFAAAAPLHGALISTTHDALAQAVAEVEPGGFVVSIAPDVTPDVAALAGQRGVRHADVLVAADGAGMRRVAELAADGTLTVEVAATFPFEDAVAACRQVASRRTAGKVVLTMPVTGA